MAHLGTGGRVTFRRRIDLAVTLREEDCRSGGQQWLPPKTGLLTGDLVRVNGAALFVHVDALGYHSLHCTLSEAFADDNSTRVGLTDWIDKPATVQAAIHEQFSCDLADWTLYMGRNSFDTAAVEEKFGSAIGTLACGALVCNFIYDLEKDRGQPDWRVYQSFELTGTRSETVDCFLQLCTADDQGGGFGYQGQGLLVEVAINSRQPGQLAGTAELVFLDAPRLAFIQL